MYIADVSSVSPSSEQTEVWCIADVSSVSPSSEQTEVWYVADVYNLKSARRSRLQINWPRWLLW